jgi:hypothetical protein
VTNWRGHIIALFLLVFVGIQSHALSHATEYCSDHDEHHHEVIECHVEAIAAEADVSVLYTIIDSPLIIPHKTKFETVFVSAAVINPPGRAPPPRSPPHISL